MSDEPRNEPTSDTPNEDNATNSPHDEQAPTTDEPADPDSDPTDPEHPDNPNPSADFDPTNPAVSLAEKYAHLYDPDALTAAAHAAKNSLRNFRSEQLFKTLQDTVAPGLLAHTANAYAQQWKFLLPNPVDYQAKALAAAPSLDPSRYFVPVPDAKTLLGNDVWDQVTGAALKHSLDETFAEFAEAAKAATSLALAVEAAHNLAQQYMDVFPDNDPLPYLEKFHNDFLTQFALLVLAASRVENLMADLCEVHFGSTQFGNATHLAHTSFGRMRGYLEDNADCQACRELAADTKDPIDFRNTLVHGDWFVGNEIVSAEHKSRRVWFEKLANVTRVVKRRPLTKKDFDKLADRWNTGKPQTLRDLFESELVTTSLVSAHVATFTDLGDRCEEELERHEKG